MSNPNTRPASADVSPGILLVTHEFFPHRGGIAVFAAEMARAAGQLGHTVEVWAPTREGTDAAEPDWPFAVRRLPLGANHDVRSQWRMARELFAQRNRLRRSTLYIPEPGPLLAMLFLQHFETLRPSRLLLTLHGSEILRLASRSLTRWSTGRLFAKADGISVVSRYARDLLLEHFPSAAGKVLLTPGALRSELTACTLSALRESGDDRIVILTVARLHPRKGQLQVIEALKRLPPADRARIEYRLVGAHTKKNYEHVLQSAAATADFPVLFYGNLSEPQLSALYAEADIFAMTSVPHGHSVEGFGLVYLEASAHRLPVIAHAIGGVPEAVEHEHTGLLVSPEDPAALTAAIARLIHDPASRRRFGENGHARARRHSWRDNALALFGQPPAAAPA